MAFNWLRVLVTSRQWAQWSQALCLFTLPFHPACLILKVTHKQGKIMEEELGEDFGGVHLYGALAAAARTG